MRRFKCHIIIVQLMFVFSHRSQEQVIETLLIFNQTLVCFNHIRLHPKGIYKIFH